MTPAAQYLRMSTDHQRYSLSNQAAAIGAFALQHDLQIVRTFEDPGKSGLTLRERPGLQALLQEAVAGGAEFSKILVLDVSRWGRFQDPDQAAHYEFICREAGVEVVYVAEAFLNDGSTMSSVVKHLKRVMAGEYSRELGEKIRVGKMRHAPQGFFVGGNLPYGVRSVLVDQAGRPLSLDQLGQRKIRRDERSIFMWGPASEIEVIRKVFRWFAGDQLTLASITRRLNEQDARPRHGGAWKPSTVRCILTSEFAVGNFVYGKTSSRLKGAKVRHPPDQWIRTKVFKPIVSRKLFEAAQLRLKLRYGRNKYLDDEMLTALARLLKEKGRLTTRTVKECRYTPCANSYRKHFGSLDTAMELVGFQRPLAKYVKGREPMPSDTEMLAMLGGLHQRHGYLSVRLVNGDKTIPCVNAYTRRFGTILNAFALAGFPITHSEAVLAGRMRTYPPCGSKSDAQRRATF